MAATNENLQNELKAKRICRFCLTQQSEKLGNIYARDPKSKTVAPLHVQVMAIASMEVFSNDGMPAWVCNDCRLLFDHSYRFKQMCKRAETLLRQYPLTGQWPAPLVKPFIPQSLIAKQMPPKEILNKPQQQQPKQGDEVLPQQQPYTIHIISPAQTKLSGTNAQREKVLPASAGNSAIPKKILNSSPAAAPEPPVPVRMKREWIDDEATNFLNKVENNEELSMDDVQRLIAAADEEEFVIPETTTLPPSKSTKKPKVLNKSSIRILNKEADVMPEPRLSQPQVKKDEDGNVSIVTEILDPSVTYEAGPDPMKNAEPVETNVFPCPHCERSFPLLQLRDIHMLNHNRERLFQCGECDRAFFSKYDLQKHNHTHTGAKPFKCTVCSKAFTRASLRYRHEKTHTDIPKFICIYCEKPFLSKEEMETHTERHRKNRPFKCKVCSKSFAFKQGLERHEVIHLRDQPYPCQYCDLSFSTPSKLARHLTAHAGKRPYPCKFCHKSYLLSHHLTRHLRSHKQCKAAFLCSDCGKVYATRDELIYHSAVHATETLICPLCQASFPDVDAVTMHIKQHADGEAYACEFCDLIYITSEQLQEHVDIMHAEDMAAYHEDDKAQAQKREIAIRKTKVENETELDQTIEEFFIEDFSDEVDALDSELVEENEATVGSSVEEGRVDTNKTAQQKVLTDVVISRQTYTTQESDIEILGSAMLSDEVDPQLAGDESEFLEEPIKKRKVASEGLKTMIASTFEKDKTGTQPARRKVAEQSTQKQQVKAAKQADSTQKPKQSSAAIASMLNALPKGVSVRRSGSTAAKPAAAEEASPANKPTTSKASQQKFSEVKVSPNQTMTRAASKRTSGAASGERTKAASTNKPSTVKHSPSKSAAIATTSARAGEKVVKMMLGDKKVKVQKITVTKAEAEAMAKQGRISFKDGNMILSAIAPKSSK